MPSDQKKKRDQKKKEAAKKRDVKKPVLNGDGTNGEAGVENDCEDGDDDSSTCTGTPGMSTNASSASLSSLADGAAAAKGASNGVTNGDGKKTNGVNALAAEVDQLYLCSDQRAVTGVLASHPDSRDIQLIQVSITFHGAELLTDTKLDLNNGRRYGLIGSNGCGKSSLMSAIGNRELPIPKHIDIFHLQREMPPSDKTAIFCVMEVDEERLRLEHEAEQLAAAPETEETHDRLMEVYERLDEMDSSTAEVRAAAILHGLGFSKDMMQQKVKNFSGGWRMRIALARALYIKPAMMLLDEPTNHLDLDACVWLEQYLQSYKRILVIISHSQDFMNGVCTNIIHMNNKKLHLYGGNYDMFMQTRGELEENQMKKFKWEQDQIAHMKNYIARFGHGSAKLARQAQSKEKTLGRMVEKGLTEKVVGDKSLSFYFLECGEIPPPVIQVQNVSFRYKDDSPLIYKNLEFGLDLDTRIALVGPNGAGKTTLLKLIAGEHLHEILDLDMTALDWMMSKYPEVKEREDMRRIIGRYGLTGQQQTCPIRNLSDGQRCRVTFAWLAWQRPHLLLLDEPTNHLDMETIDALAEAINAFDGGMMLVSHDFRLISQVAEEIWICNKQKVTKWEGDIFSFKQSLIAKLEKEKEKANKKK